MMMFSVFLIAWVEVAMVFVVVVMEMFLLVVVVVGMN